MPFGKQACALSGERSKIGYRPPRRSSSSSQEAIVAGKFEVYKDKAGKFRFRLKASNGQVVATGEAYETRAAAMKGCESVVKASTGAPVVEVDA
jgi:uncharacterized protein YegP (UPF0339 family)